MARSRRVADKPPPGPSLDPNKSKSHNYAFGGGCVAYAVPMIGGVCVEVVSCTGMAGYGG